ncbi:unnamed protein product [Adineta ricciae]|uniref:N-terminal methionine N(alpha)-acetyltransferase NatE n=1 Tax=Adineta ricciae TaxID=249248 RepID=A0A815SXP3_ADIRI|nr:unnamed protein product [Adineta ricciae]CAF1499788.1 unnamed protein product [Adineta ricciae]
MRRLLQGIRQKKDLNDLISSPSSIQIYHHIPFPLNDLLGVLYPLFGSYYPFEEFLHMIYTVHHIFCAYDIVQNRCVGCALLNNTDNTNQSIYIMLFGVQQTNQNQGVGTYLLQTVIQWAHQAGYQHIHLDVFVENYKAIGLYEKVGFQKYKFLPNYYIHTSKRPPHAIRMVLSFV